MSTTEKPAARARVAHANMTALIQACHNQLVAPMHDSDVRDDATCCVFKIVMELGHVSAPHVHRDSDIYIVADSQSAPALTLVGENYDEAHWMMPGGMTFVPAGVPHVALAPRVLPPTVVRDLAVDGSLGAAIMQSHVLVTELRTSPHWRNDVHNRPDDIGIVCDRIRELGLDVDLPELPTACLTGGDE